MQLYLQLSDLFRSLNNKIDLFNEYEELDIILDEIEKNLFGSIDKETQLFKGRGHINLLHSFYYLLIHDNFDFNFYNPEKGELVKEIKEYRDSNGGYSLIKGENSNLFGTTIGIMLLNYLEGKDVYFIF